MTINVHSKKKEQLMSLTKKQLIAVSESGGDFTKVGPQPGAGGPGGPGGFTDSPAPDPST